MSHTEQAKYPTDLTDEQWQIFANFCQDLRASEHPNGLPSRYHQRDSLRCTQRLCLASVAARISQMENRLRNLPPLAQRWNLAEDSRFAPRQASRRQGRKTSPSAAIIDSQTVKTTEVGGERGYDAGKKVNGRKRHIIVDTLGLILALVVHPANVQDQDGALLVLGILAGLRPGFID